LQYDEREDGEEKPGERYFHDEISPAKTDQCAGAASRRAK
jgi:hypothetical protein